MSYRPYLYHLEWLEGSDHQHLLLYFQDLPLGIILDMGFHPDRISCTYQGANGDVYFLNRVDLDPSDVCIAERYYQQR